MDKEEVLAEVGRRASSIECVRTYRFLTEQLRRDIYMLERQAERDSLETGIMPFVNRGVWAALERQFQFVLVMENRCEILGRSNNLVVISDEEGNIVGEWLTEERRREMEGRDDVHMLGKDFALYRDVETTGKMFFVLPDIDFPYLEGIPGVKNVTSGSLSVPADHYVRKVMMLDDPTLATHLVGFDLDI